MIADGIHVFAPIVYSHSVALFRGLPIDFEFWRTFDRSMIGWSDEVHVLKLDGWEESRGIGEELIIAAELGKPVRYIVSADHNAVEIY